MSQLHSPKTSHSRNSSADSALLSPRTPGLPSDEYAALAARQRLEHVYENYATQNSSSTSSRSGVPSSGFHESFASLTPEHRLHISKVKNATRAALGPSFNFDNESYMRVPRDDKKTQRGEFDDEGGRPIPQKYRDEFNKLWNSSDEEDSISHLKMSELSLKSCDKKRSKPSLPQLYGDGVADMLKHVEDYQASYTLPQQYQVADLTEGGRGNPALNSKFSWSTIGSEEEQEMLSRKHKLFSKVHRISSLTR